jgi:hypothetical protein
MIKKNHLTIMKSFETLIVLLLGICAVFNNFISSGLSNYFKTGNGLIFFILAIMLILCYFINKYVLKKFHS